ncbi:cytochrome P450 2J4-like [Amphiura filiformis]|uniref:cytochrome P450 2J4-like n=1 Tax=Amphiura filiformis TaxID=82378 RepID=UPI003B218B0F
MAVLQTLYSYLAVLFFDVRAVLVGLIVFLVLSWMVHGYLNQVQNLPPGPRSWPLVGCLPHLIYMNVKNKSNIYEMVETLSKQYGPVCYLSLPFGTKMVMVSGYEAVNESLTCPGLGEDRPPFPQDNPDELLNGLGVLMSSGEQWKEHRRFSLNVLRGFGVGKRSFEDQIATESAYLMKEIQSRQGQPFEPTLLFCNAVSNVICSVVFGKRFEYDDPEFKHLLHWLEGMLDQDNLASFVFLLMPKLAPYLLRIPFFPKGPMTSFRNLRSKVQDIVDEHRRTFDNGNMRDYIDVYLSESQRKNEQGVQTYLSDVELRAVVQDFFVAGTETTSTTLRWALLYMMKFPDVQKRVHEEIDSVVGRDRLPRLSDKPELPYTQAVIHEIQRFGSIVFLIPLRYSKHDTEFLEYTIPKGCMMQTNLHSATRDASVWEEPDVFKPERFLDDKGQVVKPSQQIVFGAGKHACLGEQLARMELFIFYTHLMHRFSFKKVTEGESLNIQPKPAAVLTPYPYKISAIVR